MTMRLSLRMHARSITFRNSRTLPGQGACAASRSAAGVIPLIGRFSLCGKFADECGGEVRNVVAPIAQRRDVQLDHAQAEIEIAAKLSLADSARRSRLVAAIGKHVRACAPRASPRAALRRVPRARSILACSGIGSSPISSRKIVPLCACSKRPTLVRSRR